VYCLHHQGGEWVSITLMMEAVRISKTLVYFNDTTGRYIPEGSDLHTRRRETLKSQSAI
jgi:hypothetical protein